jgi:hypothetical protein
MYIVQTFNNYFKKYIDNIIRVLFGEKKSDLKALVDSDKPAAVPPIGEPTEPMSYKVDSVSMGVASDNYSYLDQSPGDLSAMGIGGMRQPHHYESIVSDGVSIPADTNGDMSDDKLIQKHQNEINIGYKPSSNKYY